MKKWYLEKIEFHNNLYREFLEKEDMANAMKHFKELENYEQMLRDFEK